MSITIEIYCGLLFQIGAFYFILKKSKILHVFSSQVSHSVTGEDAHILVLLCILYMYNCLVN